jgi:hypothetical protein
MDNINTYREGIFSQDDLDSCISCYGRDNHDIAVSHMSIYRSQTMKARFSLNSQGPEAERVSLFLYQRV